VNALAIILIIASIALPIYAVKLMFGKKRK
jgi:hypothetical protein